MPGAKQAKLGMLSRVGSRLGMGKMMDHWRQRCIKNHSLAPKMILP